MSTDRSNVARRKRNIALSQSSSLQYKGFRACCPAELHQAKFWAGGRVSYTFVLNLKTNASDGCQMFTANPPILPNRLIRKQKQSWKDHLALPHCASKAARKWKTQFQKPTPGQMYTIVLSICKLEGGTRCHTSRIGVTTGHLEVSGDQQVKQHG